MISLILQRRIMSNKSIYRANWRSLRPNNILDLDLSNCKTCVCDGKVFIMTTTLDLYCFDPANFSWKRIKVWILKPTLNPNFILASNGRVIYYVSDNLSCSSKLQVAFIDPKGGISHTMETSRVHMADSPGMWTFDAADSKSVFIPATTGIVELTSTGMDIWNAPNQHYHLADAYLTYTMKAIPEKLKPFCSPMTKTLFVTLRMQNNSFFFHTTEFGEQQSLIQIAPFEAIPDLPSKIYVMQYYSWIVLVGIETESSPKKRVTKIRVWLLDLDKELAPLGFLYCTTMKWREVDIQNPMPKMDAVHSVTMVDTKIYVLGTNPDPTMLVLDVDVLDQARVTVTDWSRTKLTKTKGMSPSEMEIRRLKEESARSAELSQLVNNKWKTLFDSVTREKEMLQKAIEHEKNTAKEEQRNLKEENKKLKRQLESMRSARDKSEKTVLELQNKFNMERDALNKQISSLRSDLGKVKSSKDKNEQILNELKDKLALEKVESNKMIESLRFENERYKTGSDLHPLTLQQLRELQNNLKMTLVKVKSEISDRTEINYCLICTERPRNMIFSPCQHMCVCDQCASTLKDVS